MGYELSDEALATFVPIAVFWVSVGVYELLAYLLPDSHFHIEEDIAKNTVSRWTVTKGVLFSNTIQIALVSLVLTVTRSDNKGRPTSQPPLIVSAWQFLVAMFVFDSWQYFTHRWMHTNKFLYKFHSVHHGLIAPFPMGSIYSNAIDGFLTDITGGLVSVLISGMTARTSIYFFSFSLVRGVDLHSGLLLPWSPFQLLFGNNSAFHESHHQLGGFQANFSQPYFLFWDKILGTYAPYSVEKRKEGGYKVRAIKDL